MKGYCTINCDASVRDNKCGFGAKIFTDDNIIELHGPLNCYPDSNVAELYGVATCMDFLINNTNIDIIDIIVINCDNQRVRSIINSNGKDVRPFELEAKERILEFKKKFSKVYAKEIKGHSGSARGRNLVNQWCDKMANEGREINSIVSNIIQNTNKPLYDGKFRVLVKINTSSLMLDIQAKNLLNAEQIVIDKLKTLFDSY